MFLKYLHTKEQLEVNVGFAESNFDNLAYNSDNDIDDITIASLTSITLRIVLIKNHRMTTIRKNMKETRGLITMKYKTKFYPNCNNITTK
jgi:hypothetical protein